LSNLPGTWKVKKIKHVVQFVGGGTPSKANDEFWGGDIPWVSPKDVKSFRITDTQDHITEAALRSSPCSLIPAGSVLVVVRSGILQHTIPVAINDVPVCLNQDMRALIPSPEVCVEYLAYVIKGVQDRLLEDWVKDGATVESIEHDRMADTPIPVPPIQVQSRIARYLNEETARIDALLSEKRKLEERLVELRSAIVSEAVLGQAHV